MFNNGFPVYPQLYPNMNQYGASQNQGGMSPPTIHADIVQVSGEDEAWSYPVAAGSTQMMMARDDSAVYIKSAYPNSPPSLDVFVKQSVRPREGASAYVTREELDEALKALKSPKKAVSEEAVK